MWAELETYPGLKTLWKKIIQTSDGFHWRIKGLQSGNIIGLIKKTRLRWCAGIAPASTITHPLQPTFGATLTSTTRFLFLEQRTWKLDHRAAHLTCLLRTFYTNEIQHFYISLNSNIDDASDDLPVYCNSCFIYLFTNTCAQSTLVPCALNVQDPKSYYYPCSFPWKTHNLL